LFILIGKVYLALDRETEEYVALKKMILESHEEGIPSTAIREIALLKELSENPNIVRYVHIELWNYFLLTATVYRLKDVLYAKGNLYLIFEYLEQDLKQYTDTIKGFLDPLLIKVVCTCMYVCVCM